MKQYVFYLDEREIGIVFSPIRSKIDVIKLLMASTVIMLLNKKPNNERIKGKMILLVSKMSRLFFFSDEKYFSLSFPFTVIENPDNVLSFSSRLIDNINHKLTSDVMRLINSEEFTDSNCIYTFNDRIAEIEESSDGFWSLIKELIFYEDGYIRYDYDVERANGNLHPINHIDVFYSSNPTFKIGLRNKISHGSLIDLVDSQSDCHFLDTK